VTIRELKLGRGENSVLWLESIVDCAFMRSGFMIVEDKEGTAINLFLEN
jgi:hypothetical protein